MCYDNLTYQNEWDKANTVWREKFIALNGYSNNKGHEHPTVKVIYRSAKLTGGKHMKGINKDNTGWGRRRFIVVSAWNSVYSCIIIYYCTVFLINNCKPVFVPYYIRAIKKLETDILGTL